MTQMISMAEPVEWPKAVGYKLLLQPMQGEEKSAGGIVLPDSIQEANKYNVMVSLVIDAGPLTYTHDKFSVSEDRAPAPWCKVGDWVIHSEYVGTRIKLRLKDRSEFMYAVICNDDEILGRVDDPRNLAAYT